MDANQISEWPKTPSNIHHIKRGPLHLLLRKDKPYWLVVNDIGWEIVKLCNGKRDVKKISSSIALKYHAKPEIVRRDVRSCLEHLYHSDFFSNGTHEASKRQGIALKRLHLNITGKCNLRCVHCGVADGALKNTHLRKDRIFRVIDELSEHQTASLAISGGEPLLHSDCLKILKHASKKQRTSLSTNATLIDEKTARNLSSLDLDYQISLDGPSAVVHDLVRGRGNYKKALTGIRLLIKHGAASRISLFATVNRLNIGSVPDIIKLAEEMQIPSVRFLPLQKLGSAKLSWNDISPKPRMYGHLYKYLYRDMSDTPVNVSGGFQGFLLGPPVNEGRWCNLGKTLFINSGGDIYPCSTMSHPDFYIGNVRKTTLKEALESYRLKETIRECSSRHDVIDKCKNCHWKHFCQAGCPGSVFFLKGSLWETDDLCSFRQRLYPEVIFDMAGKRAGASILKQTKECEI